MSWANMMLYSSVIPSYKPIDKEEASKRNQEEIKADDPSNNKRVRDIIDSLD